MSENMLSGFSDGKDWASGSIWSNPNFQSLLAGLGGAINPKGPGGRVGSMFQNYIQSVESQKAMEQEMKKKSLWAQIMARALGLDPKKGLMPRGPYNTSAEASPTMPQPKNLGVPTTSDDWMNIRGSGR